MTAEHALQTSQHSSTLEDLVKSNLRSLSCLKDCLNTLSDQAYTQKPDPNTSAIGSHVRHIIEFYQEFLKVLKGQTQSLSYDKRARNMDIETSRNAALNALADITKTIENFDTDTDDGALELSMIVSPEQPMVSMSTTLYRETFHVLDHCVHHMAMLKMVAKRNGVQIDKNFGVANSTQTHNCQKKA